MPLNLSPYFAPVSAQRRTAVGDMTTGPRIANLAHRPDAPGAVEQGHPRRWTPGPSSVRRSRASASIPEAPKAVRTARPLPAASRCARYGVHMHSLLPRLAAASQPTERLEERTRTSQRRCLRVIASLLAPRFARRSARHTTPSSESQSRPAPSPPRRSSAARRTASRCSAASGWRDARCCGQLIATVTAAGSAPVPMVARPALPLGLPVHRPRGHWSAVLLPLVLGARSAPMA